MNYAASAKGREFVNELLAQEPNLPRAWIERQLGQARDVEAVRKLIMPPAVGVPKNWAAYRDRFIEPRRIEAGVAFWRAHGAALQDAQARWGVPASVIVGVIGVETYYGRIMGRFRALDALSTLAFDFPTGRSDRSAFFRAQLMELLRWCHQDQCDLRQVTGSYAGAIGLPQFMPGSINKYALDFDGDGHIDLVRSPADAIGSVAHYLAEHGWQKDLAPILEVTPPSDPVALSELRAPDIKPTFTATQMRERGATLSESITDEAGLLALVELENGDAPRTHVAGTLNFWVITRYNWSAYYAMAVIALGDAVAKARAPVVPNENPASR